MRLRWELVKQQVVKRRTLDVHLTQPIFPYVLSYEVVQFYKVLFLFLVKPRNSRSVLEALKSRNFLRWLLYHFQIYSAHLFLVNQVLSFRALQLVVSWVLFLLNIVQLNEVGIDACLGRVEKSDSVVLLNFNWVSLIRPGSAPPSRFDFLGTHSQSLRVSD